MQAGWCEGGAAGLSVCLTQVSWVPGTVGGCTLCTRLAGYTLSGVLALVQVAGSTVAGFSQGFGSLGLARCQVEAGGDRCWSLGPYQPPPPYSGQVSVPQVLSLVSYLIVAQMVCGWVCISLGTFYCAELVS